VSPDPLTILDAGPSLNFLATGNQNLLVQALRSIRSQILMPDQVEIEVRRKSATKPGFEQAGVRLDRLLAGKQLSILDSPVDLPGLGYWVRRLEKTSLAERLNDSKDLGEIIVIAHALRLREQQQRAVVLIDEVVATKLAKRLGLQVLNTEGVLRRAAGIGAIAHRGEMRSIYERMRPLDGGLVPYEQTELNDRSIYRTLQRPKASVR
jgi:hypothetical protein